MIYLLYTVHIIVCVFLILVVLLQQGKGADLSVFGGGSTQTAFGARSATTLLHKFTVTSFVLFIVTTLAIGIMEGGPEQATVMSEVMGERLEDQVDADDPVVEEGSPLAADEAPLAEDAEPGDGE